MDFFLGDVVSTSSSSSFLVREISGDAGGEHMEKSGCVIFMSLIANLGEEEASLMSSSLLLLFLLLMLDSGLIGGDETKGKAKRLPK